MRRFRTLVSLSTLLAYLVVGVVAAHGKTVLCLQSDGSVAVQQKGSRCCEHRSDDCEVDEVAASVVPAVSVPEGIDTQCSHCTDIPVGQERTSVTEAPRAKRASHDGASLASLASPSLISLREPHAFAPCLLPTTAPLEAPGSHLQTVVLRC
jgi:hypothetical protein